MTVTLTIASATSACAYCCSISITIAAISDASDYCCDTSICSAFAHASGGRSRSDAGPCGDGPSCSCTNQPALLVTWHDTLALQLLDLLKQHRPAQASRSMKSCEGRLPLEPDVRVA